MKDKVEVIVAILVCAIFLLGCYIGDRGHARQAALACQGASK